MTNEDIFFKKTIAFRFWRKELRFRVAQDLFSSFDIDVGTRFLIRTLTDAGYPDIKKILDVGSGYGPLGITMSSFFSSSTLHMLDRDALAVEYSRQNATLNGIEDVSVYGSLAYDSVQEHDFDLIVSNIPGKAGTPVITHMILDAVHHLAPNGIVAIVVITPLKELVDSIFAENPGIEVLLNRERSGHSVYHYRFTEGCTADAHRSSMEKRIYDRASAVITRMDYTDTFQTALDVSKLDALSPVEKAVTGVFSDISQSQAPNMVVYNPGQGFVPVTAWHRFNPEKITLVDRDMLALEYSKLNLAANGYDPEKIVVSHQTELYLDEKDIDLFVITLREENRVVDTTILEQALDRLNEDGLIIVGGSSTAITRVQKELQDAKKAHIYSRERSRGNSVLVLALPMWKKAAG